jgi:integrase
MGIYKKGENYYIDYYVEGRRKRENVGKSRKLAETVLAKRKVQVIEGKFLDIERKEKILFKDMAEMFLENYSKVNKKSWNRDALSIRKLNVSFADKYIYEINNLNIDEYKKKRLESGDTVATINRELACLKTILHKAVEWKKLGGQLPKIQLFKENNQRVRHLEEKEVQTLLEVSPEPLRSIIIIALYTGMRRAEIAGLRWQDIDKKEKLLTLWDTKNKDKRHIPLNNTVIETLLKASSDETNKFVFAGKGGNSHISSHYISHSFKKAVKEAGISDFRFHDLRHTFASWLVMKGIDLKTVQELLGHKDFKMTLRYSHLSPEHKKLAVEILEKNSIILERNLTGKKKKPDVQNADDGHYMDTKLNTANP